MINKSFEKYNHRVLYAEDEEWIRKPTTDLLKLLFTEVISCDDGESAFKEYERQDIDLVITDLSMPSSGLELIQKVRKDSSTIPILINTAHSEFNKILGSIGNIYMLYKPIDLYYLLTVIKAVHPDIVRHVEYRKACKALLDVKKEAEEALRKIRGR